MNSESYNFENLGLKVHSERTYSPKVEMIPLFQRSTEPKVQMLSMGTYGQKKGNHTSFDIQEKNTHSARGVGRTLLVFTLGIAELLASATAVAAGGVLGGAWFYYPGALFTGVAVSSLPVMPILTLVGIGIAVVGLKRIGVAMKRVRSLF